MKRSELILTFIQVPLDFIALVLAGWTAYAVRFSDFFVELKAPQFNFSESWYLSVVALVSLGWLAIFALAGLYNINPNRKLGADLGKIFLACSTALAAITIYIFFRGELFNSRFIVLAAWAFAILFIIISHSLVKMLKSGLYRAGIGARRTVLIGSNGIIETIKKALSERKSLGYNIANTFAAFSEQKLDALNKKNHLDEVIIADPDIDKKTALACIDWCSENHVTFKYSADLFATLSTNMSVATIAGVPIIELRKTRLDGWGSILKWFLDVFGSIVLIIVTSPIMLIAAIAILIESGGPIIYKNERVGLGGRKFNTLKFRSMYKKFSIGAQFKNQKKALELEQKLITEKSVKEGPLYKIKDDPRVTKVGKLIRRFSIDELPQFFNVLGGSMSLVGPRPHQPREVAKYEQHHKVSLNIKPGITGLAQISGRSDLEFEEEARLDAYYVENWSLLMDLIILIKTPFILLKKRKAL
jgi:exopolysaccharide biosynthesis polyprenyl glycosylphosphotransferase